MATPSSRTRGDAATAINLTIVECDCAHVLDAAANERRFAQQEREMNAYILEEMRETENVQIREAQRLVAKAKKLVALAQK